MDKSDPKADTAVSGSSEVSEMPAVILVDEEDDKEPVKGDAAPVVIDLDSYEEDAGRKKRKRVSSRCINFECESGEAVRPAARFCLSYYRVKAKAAREQEVCAECYEAALRHYEALAGELRAGRFLADHEVPLRDEYVEIDSDDEAAAAGDVQAVARRVHGELSAAAQGFLEAELPATMNRVMHVHRLEAQADRALAAVHERQQQLDSTLAEVEELQRSLQRQVDTIRTRLYTSFQHPYEELPPLDIPADVPPRPAPAVGPAPAPLPVAPPPPARLAPERRSNRNISKPASYCELADEAEPTAAPAPGPDAEAEVEVDVDGVTVGPTVVGSAGAAQVMEVARPALPPAGPLQRAPLVVGETYYAMRSSLFGAWGRVRLLEVVGEGGAAPGYRVRFEGGKVKGLAGSKVVSGKQLAYAQPAAVLLAVGTRVIAVFCNDAHARKESYFTGVVAEAPAAANRHRYLVFFDDGYAQYVPHGKVLVVAESARRVWEDIHPDSQPFIRRYLEAHPERPMVKLQPGQVVKTEWNGKWWIARVTRVDCSLAQMYFDADARTEWIYRGSTRLGPLFLEMQAAANRQERGPHIPKMQNVKKNLPYVEYTRSQGGDGGGGGAEQAASEPAPRAVARKSTNRPANTLPTQPPGPMVPFLPTPQVQQPQSKVVYFTPKSVVAPQRYVPHECSPRCRAHVTLPLDVLRGYNPLSKPLLCGWYRVLCKYKGKKVIRYRAPCARTIRGMAELHRYLRVTHSDMAVDMFDFDFWVHCLAEFVLDKTYRHRRDISAGVEAVPIPCVNYVDDSLPDFCNYSTRREPEAGVDLNLDEEFLCGCDCTDDCADKTRCACWQLTIREARTLNRRVPDDLIGYTYKRLPEFVTTGIYECNARCRCAATCLNRVVQHPLQLKLQLFKTANRGWGIRCLNDIPQGAFICIYAGKLLTDKMANEGGVNYGDEYLAELDYIEVVERQKDGYESDATDIEDEADGDDGPQLSRRGVRRGANDEEDDEYKLDVDGEAVGDGAAAVSSTRSRKRTAEEREEDTVTISDDEEGVREPSRFAPSSGAALDDSLAPRFKSVRKMFGEDEVCYIMDAKNTGNIGRFLNHSCSPNVFVQNVFVDTHDLRFPWVAFFAMNYIRAGTELTWNYNYDVGSVPGKVIFCHCGSPECRGRLL